MNILWCSKVPKLPLGNKVQYLFPSPPNLMHTVFPNMHGFSSALCISNHQSGKEIQSEVVIAPTHSFLNSHPPHPKQCSDLAMLGSEHRRLTIAPDKFYWGS